MRTVGAGLLAALQANEPVGYDVLMWIVGRDRETGEDAPLGIGNIELPSESISLTDMWTNSGTTRTYYGQGAVIAVPAAQFHEGLEVHPLRIGVTTSHAAVEQVVRLYEPRGARVQIHRRFYKLVDNSALSVEPWWKGYITSISFPRPAEGQPASGELVCEPVNRILTLTRAINYSHQTARRRNEDQGLRYCAVARTVHVPWGVEARRRLAD